MDDKLIKSVPESVALNSVEAATSAGYSRGFIEGSAQAELRCNNKAKSSRDSTIKLVVSAVLILALMGFISYCFDKYTSADYVQTLVEQCNNNTVKYNLAIKQCNCQSKMPEFRNITFDISKVG